MAYDEHLADRVRVLLLQSGRTVEEKKMMGGLTFMVNDKMCVGVSKTTLMARIGPDAYESALKLPGCRPMDFTGRPMKGFVHIDPEGTGSEEELARWTDMALAFNDQAKASKKRKK